MKKELIVQRDPKSPISEIFRTLRTNIQFMNTTKKLQTILITSTFPGEGKSYVSSNLAATFAQAGKKVILIDADMRKGRLYTIFEVAPRPGISNYLSGVDVDDNEERDITNYIQTTEVNNLLLIPAGNVPPNPSELLISTQMSELLDELKEVCDIIIVDGTPCELVTDSVILSRIVDCTVVVTAANETKKDSLSRVITNIKNVGGNLAGVVVNKIPISAKKYNEKYYYGSTSNKSMSKKQKIIQSNKTQLKKRTSEVLAKNKQDTNESVKGKAIGKSNNADSKVTSSKKDNKVSNKEKNNKLEKPKTLNRKKTEASEKTTDSILAQMNEYLQKEKKK